MTVASTRVGWNPRVVSTLVLVFLAGAATGALFMQFGLHDKLHHAAAASPLALADREALLRRFNSELGLSQDQSQKIAAVLDEYTRFYLSLQDQYDDVRATGKTQILQILNPDQRVKFEKLMNDLGPELQQQSK